MGIFDFFRKTPGAAEAGDPALVAFAIAYRLLPEQIYHRPEPLLQTLRQKPRQAGTMIYREGCALLQKPVHRRIARDYHWHTGCLSAAQEYFILEYPTPQPLEPDLNPGGFILAPYFSAWLLGPGQQEMDYYVLGQATGQGTMLRSVTTTGLNCSLGTGPAPTLPGFLQALQQGLPYHETL